MPPRAAAKSPVLAWRASVNAPRTWPNSSLSIRVSGSAAQLIGTKGPSRRELSNAVAREQIFTRAALAGQQHAGGAVGELLEHLLRYWRPSPQFAGGDDVGQSVAAREFAAQAPHLLPQAARFQRTRDYQQQLIVAERLGEVVECAQFIDSTAVWIEPKAGDGRSPANWAPGV